MRYLLFIITFIGLVFFTLLLTFSRHPLTLDTHLVQLCEEYAARDHTLEIGYERFNWLSNEGNPNDIDFFYQSCIGHITGIPASKEYMK